MQRLKLKFKDIGGLHARINTLLARSSIPRVGIVPHNGRASAKTVLDALISEPVQETVWNQAVMKRPLSKDTLVVQSPSFEYTETHNSLIVYPVPFPGKPVEFLEVKNVNESYDHIKECHLLLDIRNDPKDSETSDNASEFPRISVYDQCASTHGVSINSKMAVEANSLLQSSPKNASEFLELRKQSNIDKLRELVSDTPDIYEALRRSVFNSCRRQINELNTKLNPETAAKAANMRAEWTESAHAELEGVLMPRVRNLLYRDLAWYKLYFRSDDVTNDANLVVYGLPESKAKFEYISGIHAAPLSVPKPFSLDSPIHRLQKKSLRAVLTALSVQLPIGAVALGLHFINGFSTYSMCSLAALGVVVGLRRLQKEWQKASSEFLEAVHTGHVSEIQRMATELFEGSEERELKLEAHKAELEKTLEEAEMEIK